MVQLFNFHESGSVLVVNHEAKLEHVRHAKAAKRAYCLNKFAASSEPKEPTGDESERRWSRAVNALLFHSFEQHPSSPAVRMELCANNQPSFSLVAFMS